MAETVLFFMFCIPAIIGLAEIIHIAKLLLISKRIFKGKILVITPADNSFPEILLKTAQKKQWQGNSYAERVLVLDHLLSQENKKECAILSQKLDFKVCSKTELLNEFYNI